MHPINVFAPNWYRYIFKVVAIYFLNHETKKNENYTLKLFILKINYNTYWVKIHSKELTTLVYVKIENPFATK
jgi:hypothetical protein